MSETIKKFLYVNRKAPYGTIYALESLEERGLTPDNLLHLTYEDEDDDYAEKDSIRFVSRAELSDIMDQQDVVLSF